jgi:hypothetical protein
MVRKLSVQGRFFFQVSNYKGSRTNQVNVYEFFLLGRKFKLKFKLSHNFNLYFQINYVLLY